MRDGSFDPDLAAIDRVVQLSEAVPNDHSTDVHQPADNLEVLSDSESSVASIGDELDEDGPRPFSFQSAEVTSLFPDFPGVAESALLVHKVSGLVHVVNEDSFLLCGRKPSLNFTMYANTMSDRAVYEGCAHCKRVFGNRSFA